MKRGFIRGMLLFPFMLGVWPGGLSPIATAQNQTPTSVKANAAAVPADTIFFGPHSYYERHSYLASVKMRKWRVSFAHEEQTVGGLAKQFKSGFFYIKHCIPYGIIMALRQTSWDKMPFGETF